MAAPEHQLMQHSLRIGDVILLYSKEGRGYVFSETSRLVKRLGTIHIDYIDSVTGKSVLVQRALTGFDALPDSLRASHSQLVMERLPKNGELVHVYIKELTS